MESNTSEYLRALELIPKLTKSQRRWLARIVCGQRYRVNPKTAEQLKSKRLILYQVSDGADTATVISDEVGLAWCVYCYTQMSSKEFVEFLGGSYETQPPVSHKSAKRQTKP